ncbi:MAG: UvrD-helicase domain-containing protein [Acidiferrobacterales bacterium]|nr:UvrD-helicase domain-containing protein [Acidiferrobacterales bacterium]
MNDQPAREKALDQAQSFIVQAPAGSGKTTLLTSRFISLLETVDNPEEVLAVTFTRKATAEMRERILEVLDPNTPADLHQHSANMAAERVRKRSEQLDWNLHQQPSRLQIMTFDALAAAVIRCMPWSSRFGSVPGVVEQAEKIYRAAAVAAVESAQHASDDRRAALRLLHSHLDNNSERLLELIVAMLANRDQWLNRLFNTDFSDDVRSEMENAWRQFIGYELDNLASLFPPTARAILRLDEIDNYSDEAVKFWRKVKVVLLTQKGTWRKQYPIQATIPEFMTPANFGSVISDCSKVEFLQEKLARIGNNLPNLAYTDEQWEVLRAASTVLKYSVAYLQLEFRKRGEVDFIEIAQKALKALGTEDNPTDLSLVLDYRYRHILVDEFQDSSISQKQLLESLTAGWQDGDGRTLFLVGDPMQSIYRFREAEVGIYLDVVKRGLGNLNPTPLSLNQNFRSSKILVDWFNSTFKKSFPDESDVMGSRVAYSPCESTIPGGKHDSVNIWVQKTGRKKDGTQDTAIFDLRQAEKVYDDILDYLARNEGRDVRLAVLVSSRKHVRDLIPLLDAGGIRYYAADMFPLAERPVVQDLLSLTRALLNPTDRVSWLAILRAPWCGLTLEDLLVIASQSSATIWDRINSPEVTEDLSDDGRMRVARTREVLAQALSIRGRQGVRQWIEDAWILLGGPACVSTNDDENARLFLDFLERFAQGAQVDDLEQFEDQMQNLFAVPDCAPDEAAVHLMTIHSAKGLEFDAVFVPSTAKRVGMSRSPLMIWSEVLLKDIGTRLLISTIPDTALNEGDLMYSFLKQWNKQKDLMEMTRLVYVGCTRAKSELHLYASLATQSPPEATLLDRLWPGIRRDNDSENDMPSVIRSFTDHTPYAAMKPVKLKYGPGPSKTPIVSRLPADWKLPMPPASIEIPVQGMESPGGQDKIDFDWAGSVAVWTGTIVHQWLYRMTMSGADNWDAKRVRAEKPKWQTALRAMGMSSDSGEFAEAVRRIETALVNVLNDETGRWLLDSKHEDAKAEYRLTGYVNGIFRNVVLDRTFVDEDGVRWIVDYKTGTTDSNIDDFLDNEVQRYRDQLIEYRTILSGCDDRPIRMGLYFPLFARWREVE